MSNHRWSRLIPKAIATAPSYAFTSLNQPPLSASTESQTTRRPSRQLALLVTIWHYVSPFVVILLLYALTRKREVTMQLPDIFNPYAARPRPLNFDTSLEKVCQHRSAPIVLNSKPLSFKDRVSSLLRLSGAPLSREEQLAELRTFRTRLQILSCPSTDISPMLSVTTSFLDCIGMNSPSA